MSDMVVDALRKEILSGNALFVVGTGVSMSATHNKLASWTGLLENGLDECEGLGHASQDETAPIRALLTQGSTAALLAAATFFLSKMGGPNQGDYNNWLAKTVGSLKASSTEVLEALIALKGQLATTNYDGLLEEATGLKPYTWRKSAMVERILRRDHPGIIHLHGFWEEPESVVLDLGDYAKNLGDEHAQTMLKAIRTLKTFVFVGCGEGLVDPHFESFFKWTRAVFGGSPYVHYVLARESDAARLRQQHSKEERLRIVSYGPSFNDLAPFLRSLATTGAGPSGGGGGGGAGATRMALGTSYPVLDDPCVRRPFREIEMLKDLAQVIKEQVKLPWQTVSRLFWDSCPREWFAPVLEEKADLYSRSANLVDLLSRFGAQEAQKEDFPLLAFVLRLRIHCDSVTAEKLSDWLARAARHVGVSPGMLRSHEQQVIGNPFLLVKIERAPMNQYLIQAWLSYEKLGEFRPLFSEPQTSGRDEIPKVLSKLWTEGDPRNRMGSRDLTRLTVEFLLPVEFLSQDVDRWRIPTGSPSIGCKFRVVVRPLERVYAARQPLLEDDLSEAPGYWRGKWERFQQGKLDDQSLLWISDMKDTKEEQLTVRLQRHEKVGIVLTLTPPICPEPVRSTVVVRAIQRGIPIGLWTRLENTDSAAVQAVFKGLLTNMAEWPDLIHKARQQAAEAEAPEKEPGYHLTLLWDDPDRLPPDARAPDFQAPFQAGADA